MKETPRESPAVTAPAWLLLLVAVQSGSATAALRIVMICGDLRYLWFRMDIQ